MVFTRKDGDFHGLSFREGDVKLKVLFMGYGMLMGGISWDIYETKVRLSGGNKLSSTVTLEV